MKSRKKRTGFTRTELMVVGGCLSLLTFIMLPGLTGAREAGKRAICLANLKTLGAGMLQYAQDYEGKIPCWGCQFDEIGPQGDPVADWITKTTLSLSKNFEYGYIWEYVQNKKPFVCPALTNKMNPKQRVGTSLHSNQVWGWPDGAGTANPPGPMWSYCVNAQVGLSMQDQQWRVNPELVMPSPKTVFMLYEGDFNDYASYDNTVVLFNPTYNFSNNSEDSLGRYHMVLGAMEQPESSTFNNKKGSGNLVYFDGHVGTMTLEEFISQRSTAAGTLELCGGYQGFSGW